MNLRLGAGVSLEVTDLAAGRATVRWLSDA